VEVVMKDGTRCDILTATHAIEVDFAKKWAEGGGDWSEFELRYADGETTGNLLSLTLGVRSAPPFFLRSYSQSSPNSRNRWTGAGEDHSIVSQSLD